MPLMICSVYETGAPFHVIPFSAPIGAFAGTIACKPLDPAAVDTAKLRTLPVHWMLPNAEPFRPSIQVSICLALTTVTPWPLADPITKQVRVLVAAKSHMY